MTEEHLLITWALTMPVQLGSAVRPPAGFCFYGAANLPAEPTLKKRLEQLTATFPAISNVRGLGLMIGVELVKRDGTNSPDGKLREKVVQRTFENGLLLLGCGESTVRFSPPLIVNQKEAETAVEIFASTLKELTQ